MTKEKEINQTDVLSHSKLNRKSSKTANHQRLFILPAFNTFL